MHLGAFADLANSMREWNSKWVKGETKGLDSGSGTRSLQEKCYQGSEPSRERQALGPAVVPNWGATFLHRAHTARHGPSGP